MDVDIWFIYSTQARDRSTIQPSTPSPQLQNQTRLITIRGVPASEMTDKYVSFAVLRQAETAFLENIKEYDTDLLRWTARLENLTGPILSKFEVFV